MYHWGAIESRFGFAFSAESRKSSNDEIELTFPTFCSSKKMLWDYNFNPIWKNIRLLCNMKSLIMMRTATRSSGKTSKMLHKLFYPSRIDLVNVSNSHSCHYCHAVSASISPLEQQWKSHWRVLDRVNINNI